MTQRNSQHNADIISPAAIYPGFIPLFNNGAFPISAFKRDTLWSQLNDLFRKYTDRNQLRRQQAIHCGKNFLDELFPLASGSHHDVTQYHIYYQHFCAITADGKCMGLKKSGQFSGFNGPRENPSSIMLKTGDLQVEIQIEPTSPIGAADKAGITDIKIQEGGK